MTGRLTSLLATLVVASQFTAAHADSVTRTIGTTSIDLALPKGQCVLEEDNAHDAKFITVIRALFKGAGNTLFLATAECSLRSKLRSGASTNILNYTAYYTPDPQVAPVVSGETADLRKSLCTDMRKQGDATLVGVKDTVAKVAKEIKADVAINSTKYIGVLDEDEHGCYAGLLIGVQGADKKPLLMSSVVTSTVVHGKMIFLAVYNEYSNPEVITALLQNAKNTMLDLDRKNP